MELKRWWDSVCQRRSFALTLRNRTLCVCWRRAEEGEEGLGVQAETPGGRVVYLGLCFWGRSDLICPLGQGSPVAPQPQQLLLLLSHPKPVELLHRLTLYERDQESEVQRSHSWFLAPHPFPPSSFPLLLTLLLPHLLSPLNLQSPAVHGPVLRSVGEPGRGRARATPRLL